MLQIFCVFEFSTNAYYSKLYKQRLWELDASLELVDKVSIPHDFQTCRCQ